MFRKALKKNLVYYIWYTVFFGIICGSIILIYGAAGKSFVWNKDGLAQHYPVMIYIHNYINDFVTNLLNGQFVLPQVDLKIGQGMDVLTTLNYYGFGDPLMLIVAICPVEKMEIMYGIVIFLRLYLAGLFFSFFCFVKGNDKGTAVVMGALLYVFSGYGLFASVRHPFFVDGMIFLPLILTGIERILKRKKYGFFIWVIAYSMTTNFYFTYMNTVIMAIYILFRLMPKKKYKFFEKCRMIAKMAGAYLWGIVISGVVAIPVILAYIGCSRGGEGGYSGSLLFYDKEFYLKFLGAYFFPSPDIGEWTNLSFTIFGMFGIYILFRKCRNERRLAKKRILRIGYLLLTAMMLVPFAGKVMNGFGYVSNRWNYAYAMLIAYIVVFNMPELIDLIGFWLCKISAKFSSVRVRKVVESAMSIIMVAVLVLQTDVLYTQFEYDEQFVDAGSANSYLTDTAVEVVSDIEQDNYTRKLYRTEQAWHIGNQSIALNYFGHSWYFSIAPKSFCKHYNGFELNAMERTYSLRGLDSRAMLNELASTRYYVTDSKDDGLIPYKYRCIGSMECGDDSKKYLYTNDCYLPMGYTVDKWISGTDYDKLSPIEKQEALMQCVMLEEKDGQTTGMEQVSREDLSLLSKETDAVVTNMQGMTYQNGVLNIFSDNATMDLEFSSPAGCETYLHLNGIDVIKNSKQYQTCSVSCDDTENHFVLMNPEKSAWYENSDLTVNLGYSTHSRKKCRITIPYKGIYSLENFTIISQSMTNYTKYYRKLSKDTLDNLEIRANEITGDIELEEEKMMQLSVPYSEGWSLYIDDEPCHILNSNDMYMTFVVPEGKHAIKLCYTTRGLKAGIAFSSTGSVAFLIVVCYHSYSRKKSKRSKVKRR